MHIVLAALAATTLVAAGPAQPDLAADSCVGDVDRTPLSTAQRLFYNGDYHQSASMTVGACEAAESLELCELRTSALLFGIKRAIGHLGYKIVGAAW
jgi:hypothetical protein